MSFIQFQFDLKLYLVMTYFSSKSLAPTNKSLLVAGDLGNGNVIRHTADVEVTSQVKASEVAGGFSSVGWTLVQNHGTCSEIINMY